MVSRLPSVSFGIGRRVRDIPSILTVIEDMFSSLGMFITTCSQLALDKPNKDSPEGVR